VDDRSRKTHNVKEEVTMKKSSLLIMLPTAGLLLVLVGCNAEKKEAASTPAVETTTEAAPAATDHPAAAGTEVAATHDCAGVCGMTNVPTDHMTEINGKFYCGGCAVTAREEAAKAEGAQGNG
jgi:hypothetical protein